MKEKFSTSRLLAIMLCLELASMSVSAIYYGEDWLTWIYRGVTVAIYCFWFLLGINNRSYRLTAYFKVTALFLILAGWLMSSNDVLYFFYEYFGKTLEDLQVVISTLYWIRTAVTLVAVVLECLSHGKIAPAIRKGWIAFLIAQLAWIVIGNLANRFAQAQFESQRWSREMLEVYNGGVQIVDLVVQLFYLWLLFRTARAAKEKESV